MRDGDGGSKVRDFGAGLRGVLDDASYCREVFERVGSGAELSNCYEDHVCNNGNGEARGFRER